MVLLLSVVDAGAIWIWRFASGRIFGVPDFFFCFWCGVFFFCFCPPLGETEGDFALPVSFFLSFRLRRVLACESLVF